MAEGLQGGGLEGLDIVVEVRGGEGLDQGTGRTGSPAKRAPQTRYVPESANPAEGTLDWHMQKRAKFAKAAERYEGRSAALRRGDSALRRDVGRYRQGFAKSMKYGAPLIEALGLSGPVGEVAYGFSLLSSVLKTGALIPIGVAAGLFATAAKPILDMIEREKKKQEEFVKKQDEMRKLAIESFEFEAKKLIESSFEDIDDYVKRIFGGEKEIKDFFRRADAALAAVSNP